MNSLLNLEPPLSAVFVASDVVAIGAMKAIRDHDLKIPEDIALAGFDDVSFSRYILPPLTTIRLPAVELAYQASEMLIQLINGEEPPRKKVCLGTDLIIRASSGPAV